MSEYSTMSNDNLIKEVVSCDPDLRVCSDPNCVYCGAIIELKKRLGNVPESPFIGVKFEYEGDVTVNIDTDDDEQIIKLEDWDSMDDWFYANLPWPQRMTKTTGKFKISVECVG